MQSHSYVFKAGEYKFELIDNFGRGAGEFYYYGLGVNNVNTINYGKGKVLNDLTYTKGPVTLSYQLSLYSLVIEKEVDGHMDIVSPDNVTIKEIVQSATNVSTITFDISENNISQRFRATLTLERTNQTFVYDFVIYRVLPNVELYSSSGIQLQPAFGPFTEEIVISWKNSSPDFNTRVSLTREYLNQKETIAFIPKGYIINGNTRPGLYTATVENDLGYTKTLTEHRFEVISGKVEMFNIVTISKTSETVLTASSTSKDSIIIGQEPQSIYNYFAFDKFNSTDETSENRLQVRVSSNKGLASEYISALSTPNSKIFRIYGIGYEQYVRVNFIEETLTFANFTIKVPILDEHGVETNYDVINTDLSVSPLKLSNAKLYLEWNSFNSNPLNTIYADYYFNNNFIKSIYNLDDIKTEFGIYKSGTYKFEFRDLAGNFHIFNNNQTGFTINLVNNVIFTANNSDPIDTMIVNDLMKIKATHTNLYIGDPSLTAKLNGQTFTVSREESISEFIWNFKQQGYYEIKLTANILVGSEFETIETIYNFIIINKDQKLLVFDIPQNYNFTVETIVLNGQDITHLIPNRNQLWLSPEATGIGQYNITLKTFIEHLNEFKTFRFDIYIFDEIPEITASIDFGTATTKNITINFNLYRIYESLGESYIKISDINGKLLSPIMIYVTNNSLNRIDSFTLTENTTYFVEIFTLDAKLVTSYKLTKNEPLNTTAIIIIVIASIVFLGLVIVFVILRRRVKFR